MLKVQKIYFSTSKLNIFYILGVNLVMAFQRRVNLVKNNLESFVTFFSTLHNESKEIQRVESLDFLTFKIIIFVAIHSIFFFKHLEKS